jgi:hypothetical protein
MKGVRKERYGLRQVDTFEQAAGLKPQPVNLPPLKSTEIWDSPVFQALMVQQQAIETEAELEARQAQLHALMKRVAAERRLPIEDIKRVVNEIARGAGGRGAAADNLPAKPPGYDPNPDELRQGEGILEGEAAKALLQHVYASIGNPVLPQELKVHKEIASDIGAIGGEHQALSIDTQAQESFSAIKKRDEDMRVAKKHQNSISNMFSLQSAGKAALAATKGAARSAHAFANYMITPEEEEESWMAPSPGLFGIMKDIGGDISSMATSMIAEPQAVR